MSASFERFCLAAGLEALAEMMQPDAPVVCGERHKRDHRRKAHRWGKTKGKIGFHGGKVEMVRPRLRGFDGKEQTLPSWEAAQSEDWLGKWAMNQMLINVSTRKFKRSMRSRCACPRATCRRRREQACRDRQPPGFLLRCRRCR